MTKIRAQACIMENNIWSFHKALDRARESRPQTQRKSQSSIFQENTQTCHLKSRSIVARHVTPHSASAAFLRGARCSPTHDPWRQKASKDAIKSPARSPVGARQHHAGTRPLKRTADLVTEIGAGNLRGVGEKSRRNGTTNWWRRRVARARARGSHQRWAALPGRGVPRARARRDARRRPATRGRGRPQP